VTGSILSSSGLDERRRRALFRSRHRGLREMDLLLGQFSDAHLARLTDRELTDYEALMDAPDAEVFSWLTGAAPTPAGHDTPLFRKLLQFHTHSGPLAL
jgi:antitoxin CptB